MAYQSGTGGSNETATATLTSGSDRMGIVAHAMEVTTVPTGMSATLDGNALTSIGQVVSIIDGGSYSVLTLWYAPETVIAAGSTGAISVSLGTGGAGHQGRSTMYAQFSGRSQSAPTFASAGGSATGTSATATASASAANADLFGACGHNGTATNTLGGDLTTSVYAAQPGGDHSNEIAYAAGVGSGSRSATFTWGVTARYAVAAVIMEATGGDTTAPVLTSPVGTTTGSTTATVGATTDEGNGTLYAVVTTSSTAPSVAQIKAGQNHLGASATWSGSTAVSSTGAKTLSATGLSAVTTYYAHLVHTDAATNNSNVVSSASFTTYATYITLRATF